MNYLARLTVPGALATAVPRYEGTDAQDMAEAIASVETGLHRKYQNGVTNPYHIAIGTDLYHTPGLQGDWTDIAKAFVAPIGEAFGVKIAGRPPQQQAPVIVQSPGMPTWAKGLLIGGGVLTVGLILYKVLKR